MYPPIIGFIILIIFYLVFGFTKPIERQPNNLQVDFKRQLPIAIPGYKPIIINAHSAVAFDASSKARIFNQNGDELRPIASITKLMTALVFLDTKPNWDQEIIIIKEDLQAGAKANIFVGDKIKVADLFKASLMASDNSAVTALVRSTGLSKKDFVARMNSKVKQLHLVNLEFTDPTGLDAGNLGTAASVAKLAEAALRHKEISDTLKLYKHSFKVSPSVSRQIVSTDQLIGLTLPLGAKLLLGKTGHIDEAGYCFVGIFGYDNNQIITSVLGASEDEKRFSETIKILDWTLRGYLWDNKEKNK